MPQEDLIKGRMSCLPERDGLGPGLQGSWLRNGPLELLPVDGAVVIRIHLKSGTREGECATYSGSLRG